MELVVLNNFSINSEHRFFSSSFWAALNRSFRLNIVMMAYTVSTRQDSEARNKKPAQSFSLNGVGTKLLRAIVFLMSPSTLPTDALARLWATWNKDILGLMFSRALKCIPGLSL